jgi:hypothetical protein
MSTYASRPALTLADLPAQALTSAQAEAIKGGSYRKRTTDIVGPLEGEILSHGDGFNSDPDGNEDIDVSGPGNFGV